jgi:hypothetical protein
MTAAERLQGVTDFHGLNLKPENHRR